VGAYSAELLRQLSRQREQVARELQLLSFEGLKQSQTLKIDRARIYLQHGVGRRIAVLRQSLKHIFDVFPPGRKLPLNRDEVVDIQIHLHAFVINLSGVFDNWAWAFVCRHELEKAIGGHRNVGSFKTETQRFLPAPLREYLTGKEIAAWQNNYLRGYRDALAHRIPLYVPPASWTGADTKRYEELEQQKAECIQQQDWARLDAAWAEQDAIGTACPTFLHEYSIGADARPVFMHPQLICDAMTVVDFGRRFYAAWHERS